MSDTTIQSSIALVVRASLVAALLAGCSPNDSEPETIDSVARPCSDIGTDMKAITAALQSCLSTQCPLDKKTELVILLNSEEDEWKRQACGED